jgi:hypothetical protein
VAGAIFHDTKGKEKRQEDTDEGSSGRNSKKKKKKNKQSCRDPLVAAAERKNPRAPPEGGPGVFNEMLKKPCPNHRGPIKHVAEPPKLYGPHAPIIALKASDCCT